MNDVLPDDLVVAPCTQAAALYAVTHWHYSGKLARAKIVRHGVWESDRFAGAITYGLGACQSFGVSLGIGQYEVCELTRIALRHDHAHPVSQILVRSIELLKTDNPGLRAIISFADPREGHHGGVYQASNWIYLGRSDPDKLHTFDGEPIHGRAVSTIVKARGGMRPGEDRLAFLTRTFPKKTIGIISVPGKHRYVFPLDNGMRRALAKRSLPYPEQRGSSVNGDAPGPRPGEPDSISGIRST